MFKSAKLAVSFYRRWFATAFHGLWHSAELAAFLAISAIDVAKHYNPKLDAMLSSWVWAVPFWAFLALIVYRVVSAPYKMWREDQAEFEALRVTSAAKYEQEAVREMIGEFLGEARGLLKRAKTPGAGQPDEAEVNEWYDKVQEYVREKLGQSYVQQIANGAGTVSYSSPGESPLTAALHVVNIRLGELLDKLS